MQAKVAIIILNWNGYKVTQDCLNSLVAISYYNYRIIIVDNGSQDGSVEHLNKAFQYANIDILSLDTNQGFTGGNNVGIKYAQKKYDPDFYLLLNNDTIVDRCFLNEMLNAYYRETNCFAVVPKTYYYDNTSIIDYAGGSINKLTGIVKEYGKNKKDSSLYNYTKKITFMSGCCALICKEAICSLGLLDETFFAYSEDADYSLRILNANRSILYVPEAIIYHKSGYSSDKNKGKWLAFYLATRNLILLQKKHLSKPLIPLFFLIFSIRWVAFLSIKLSLLKDFKSVKAIFYGVNDGVNNRLRFVNS